MNRYNHWWHPRQYDWCVLYRNRETLERRHRRRAHTDTRHVGPCFIGQAIRSTIHGVRSLHEASHSVIPDRIEAGTYLIAGAMVVAQDPTSGEQLRDAMMTYAERVLDEVGKADELAELSRA